LTISEEKSLMINSPHSVISLPMSVNESSQNENHDTLYFCIYDMNGEVIKKEDIHYVIIINDLDTIWEMQSHEIIMNNYHSKIEHLQVAIIDIDPPYTAFNLPTNGDLIYERYSPSSSQSNQFIFKIYYMPYLWNYIGLENERVRFRRKKLILMNNTKLYQK